MKIKSKSDYKKLFEVFGWQIADHSLDALWKLYQAPEGTTLGYSMPRQNFKTETAAIFLFEGALAGEHAVYFAHSADLQREMMRRLAVVCRPLVKEGLVKRINDNQGAKEIEFMNGAIIYCRVRTQGATVGLAKIGRIVFDEAQKMSRDFEGDVRPTMTHGKSKKSLMIGTPPTKADLEKYPDNSLLHKRNTGGTYWIEISAGLEYDPSLRYTEARARKANPGSKYNPSFLKSVRADMENLSHERFWQERMGLWIDVEKEEKVDPELKAKEISLMMTKKGSRQSGGFICGVGLLPNSDKAYITMNDGRIMESAADGVENTMEFDVSSGDLDQIADWIKARSRMIRAIMIPANARGKALNNILLEKKMKKQVLLTLPDTGNRLARMLKYARQGQIKIYDNDRVRLALASFWVRYDERSGSGVPAARAPHLEAQVLSLVVATEPLEKVERREKAKAAAAQIDIQKPAAKRLVKQDNPHEKELTPAEKRAKKKKEKEILQSDGQYGGDWGF